MRVELYGIRAGDQKLAEAGLFRRIRVQNFLLPTRHLDPVILVKRKSSVAEPWCLSRIWLFSIPDPTFSIPEPGSASKNLSILTRKLFIKLSELWSGLFIPDPPGVKKHQIPYPGSQHWEKQNFEFILMRFLSGEKSLFSKAFQES